MRMTWTRAALLTLVAIGVVAGSAQAGIDVPNLPVYFYVGTDTTIGESRPFIHTDPNDWTVGSLNTGWSLWTDYTSPAFMPFNSGTSIYFALDNRFDPYKWKQGSFEIVTTTPGFFGTELQPWNPTRATMSFGVGYDEADFGGPIPSLYPKDYDAWTTVGSLGRSGTVRFWADRQCSWEWVKVTNKDGNTGLFSVKGGSYCTATPEPSLGLLLLAGIIPLGIGLRRRQRRLADK